jgi:hypothetical protein
MLQRQEEVADVDVVLKPNYPGGNSAAVEELRALGLQINDVDDADGVVEGTIVADRLKELQRLPCVADLRDVFTYLAAEGDDEDEVQPEGGH